MDTGIFGPLGEWNIILFGIGIVIFIIIICSIKSYNSIINVKNTANESFSAIDTVLQNRYNLIPNLIAIVKQYMVHEASLINNVSEMRAKLLANNKPASTERFEDENILAIEMKSIFDIAEDYPDVKASNNFLELQAQWSEMEDRLQGARRAYNAAVKELDNKKEMFPSNIVARTMSLPKFSLFKAELDAKVEKMDAKSMFAN